MTDRKRAALARLMLFTGAILWGSSYFVLKNTLDEVPLFLLLSIRFFFAGLILLLSGHLTCATEPPLSRHRSADRPFFSRWH